MIMRGRGRRMYRSGQGSDVPSLVWSSLYSATEWERHGCKRMSWGAAAPDLVEVEA